LNPEAEELRKPGKRTLTAVLCNAACKYLSNSGHGSNEALSGRLLFDLTARTHDICALNIPNLEFFDRQKYDNLFTSS
jgi:hypothetical protein